MVLIAFGGYMLWSYHLGKPMAPFFWLRLKGWTSRGIALFEIFSLTNSVSLEEARKEVGDGFRLYTPTKVEVSVKKEGRVKKFLDYILARKVVDKYEIKRINRVQNLVMPKSTYSINGVCTIPLWDLHPQLHIDLLEGIKVLISKDIKTLTQLTEFCEVRENAEETMFKNYNYRTFLDLYLSVRQKYNISISTNDVINFIGKQFDKNFRESIEAKDFNVLQKGRTENKYILYGYVAIILTILIIGVKVLYTTFYGGKAT
jgi:hypothetical protein